MKSPVLEKEGEDTGSRAKASGSTADLATLEKRLAERLDARMDEVKKGVADGLAKLQERVSPLIDERVKKALSGSFAALTNTTKEALTNVVQAILFDSGILERLVKRLVDEKVGSLGGAVSGGAGAGLSDEARKEVAVIVAREVAATLSGEQMKTIIDDKFRAITLYLKSDVIPKALGDVLKDRARATAAAPAK